MAVSAKYISRLLREAGFPTAHAANTHSGMRVRQTSTNRVRVRQFIYEDGSETDEREIEASARAFLTERGYKTEPGTETGFYVVGKGGDA